MTDDTDTPASRLVRENAGREETRELAGGQEKDLARGRRAIDAALMTELLYALRPGALSREWMLFTRMVAFVPDGETVLYPDMAVVADRFDPDAYHYARPILVVEIRREDRGGIAWTDRLAILKNVSDMRTILEFDVDARSVRIHDRSDEGWTETVRPISAGPIPTPCGEIEITLD